MDALKFLREVQRMHNYYTSIYHDCLKCPMADMPCRIPVTDWGGSVLNTCVERAEQWSKEHPQRTRLQDFMGKYPNAEVYPDGQPVICCARLGYRKYCGKSFDDNHEGFEVCFNCWNMPVEEDE